MPYCCFLSYKSKNVKIRYIDNHILGVTKLKSLSEVPQKPILSYTYVPAVHVDAHKYSLEAKTIKKPLAGRKG